MDIIFSIILSKTYSVPVLWFRAASMASLDELYEVLVPPHLSDSVRDVGVLGGISQAYHPLTEIPAYFVHPCRTHEALRGVDDGQNLPAEEYLLVWFGIIAAAVGLYVPSKLICGRK
ncbi:uncharacterized protein HMPREF1541_06362 [Cyphellophora europaea CBS 101466]|uniref:Ubiquitin-like-conjugating enzyme ATG10 n=1 Tax=Cyphellophora europaea (strain CBS 101466) TaxID=1220924 RepID=W2RPC6_CYPE1|nr:uncharacterized protein HMPREF1541_06362 [Cyphellophora europaea CBS 101466]ETN38327.1 hypothetical protein HMPREF1541_06362 [Cyphellophora europaea CBS 101466]